MRISARGLVAGVGLVALLGLGCCRDGTARTASVSRGFAEIAQRVHVDTPAAPELEAKSEIPDLTKGTPMHKAPRRALAAARARSVESAPRVLETELPGTTARALPETPHPVAPPVPPDGAGAAPTTSGPSPELAYDPMVEAPPAPPAPVRRAPAPEPRRAPAAATVDEGPITGWHPSPGVAVASGIGLAGLAVGGLSAGLDTPSTGMSALGLGIGAAGFLTAGVIMLVEQSETRPVEVGVGPASVVARGAF